MALNSRVGQLLHGRNMPYHRCKGLQRTSRMRTRRGRRRGPGASTSASRRRCSLRAASRHGAGGVGGEDWAKFDGDWASGPAQVCMIINGGSLATGNLERQASQSCDRSDVGGRLQKNRATVWSQLALCNTHLTLLLPSGSWNLLKWPGSRVRQADAVDPELPVKCSVLLPSSSGGCRFVWLCYTAKR